MTCSDVAPLAAATAGSVSVGGEAQKYGTRIEPASFDQAQRDTTVEPREKRRADAEDHRVDDQPVLVDQAPLDERRREGRSADDEVARKLLSNAGECVSDPVAEEPAVPLDGSERPREHDL